MPQVQIRVSGIDELVQRMNNISRRLPDAMGGAMGGSVDIIHERLSGYTQEIPPKPEGSTYDRTFELQESIDKGWTGLMHKTVGWVRSILGYAPLVMGAASQVPLHQGRWWTQQDVADEMFPEVESLFVEATKQLVADTTR